MGTSLTPEFWQRFAVLLVVAVGVTVVLTAAFDVSAVRLLSRRAHKPPTPTPCRPLYAGHRPSVHS
jgi:hypothetical protein